MKKNAILKKIVITLLIVFLCISFHINCYKVYATGFDTAPLDGFDKAEGELGISEVTGTMDDITATVITVVRIAAVAIAIVMLLVIGMRYMVAAPGDRADIKKHAVAYVVGAFILFGVSGILKILLEFSNNISGNGGEP